MKKKGLVPAIIALVAAVASIGTLTVLTLNGTFSKQTAPKKAVMTAQKTEKATEAVNTIVPETVEVTTEPVTEGFQPQNQETYSEADKVYAAAKEAVAQCTNDSMSKDEKLRAAFNYIKQNYLEGVRRDNYTEMDWPVVYANDLLICGKGDCFSYGAAFAYMAKAIGCSDCYACNSGGHGWAEVEGKVYDPEWSLHSSKYSYCGMSYDDPSDVPYKTALGTADWMHVAV